MYSLPQTDFLPLFESTPGLYLILLPDFKIAAVNDGYLSATITHRKDIIGRSILDVFPHDPTDNGASNLRFSLHAVLKNKEAHTMAPQKYDLPRPDGSFEVKYWSPMHKPIFNAENEIVYIIHSVEDITELVNVKNELVKKDKTTEDLRLKIGEMETEIFKRTGEIQGINVALEQTIKERTHEVIKSENQFRHLLENMLEGIQIIGFDWRYIYVNDTIVKHGRYSKEELLGHTMMEKYPGIEHTDVFKVMQRCMTERIPQQLENEFVYPDNTKGYFELRIQPAPEGILVLSIDITDHKRAEEKLKASEAENRSLIDQATDGIFISDEKGKFVDVNVSACNLLGYSKEELVNLTVFDILLKEEATNNPPIIDELLTGKSVLTTRQLIKKNGSLVPAEINSKRMPNGKIIGMARDITERKAVQEKLEKNEKLFRAMIEKNADMMTLALPEGKLIYISPSLTNNLGFSFEEYQSKPGTDFVHPDDVPGLMEQMMGIMDSPGKSFFRQHRLLHKDGTYRWCEGTITNMLHDADVGALVSNFRDITDRKKAEESLKKAEANYREIFEKASDAIYVHEIETGRVIELNRRATEITGYSKEELLRTIPEKLITDHPDYTFDKAIQNIQKAAMGEPQLFEWLSKHKDGSHNWLEVNLKKATIAGEERILAFFREIKERKKAEEKILKLNEALEQKVMERTAQLEINIQQLKESEEKFQKAFQASAAGVSITRLSDSTFLDVNDAFVNMTGYSKQELIGRTSIELGMTVNIEKRDEVLKHIKEQGFAKYFEMSIRSKSGSLLEILASVETILLSGDQYAINIIFDITDRKKMEEELKTANKDLEAFSYSVAHDLRAPLRIIDGYSGILMEEYYQKLDKEGHRLLNLIIGNTRQMGKLIDDLLNFSQLGRLSLNTQKVSVQDLLRPIIEEQLILTPNARIEFKIGNLESLNCDSNLMRRVFSNLISNAIKYSGNKEKPIIEIGSEKKGHEIIYFVKDNGVGFDMHYADKLFGVFQRLHKASEFEGTGVGLAIVQRIIVKHGGKTWAEGETDKGATFYFCLPA